MIRLHGPRAFFPIILSILQSRFFLLLFFFCPLLPLWFLYASSRICIGNSLGSLVFLVLVTWVAQNTYKGIFIFIRITRNYNGCGNIISFFRHFCLNESNNFSCTCRNILSISINIVFFFSDDVVIIIKIKMLRNIIKSFLSKRKFLIIT